MKRFVVLFLLALLMGCPKGNDMPETADIAVIDAESEESTPWGFSSIWKDGGCDFSRQATAAQHGGYGFRFTGDGINNYGYGRYDLANLSSLYARTYFTVDPTLTDENGDAYVHVLQLLDSPTALLNVGFRTSALGIPDAWYFYGNGGGGHQETADGFSYGNQHYADIYFYAGSGADGVERIWIDGVMIYEVTGADLSTRRADRLCAGQSNNSTVITNGKYIDVDDVLINTTGPIGAYYDGPAYVRMFNESAIIGMR